MILGLRAPSDGAASPAKRGSQPSKTMQIRRRITLKNTTFVVTIILAVYLVASPILSTGNKPQKLPGIGLKRFKKVLVFGPHPDDEILGCGCTLARLKKYGSKIKIVIVTNGEGFKYAVQLANLTPSPRKVNFMQFARKRQLETIRALKLLHIKRRDVYFLGFPDGGISKLWSSNWDESNPYRSPYSHATHSLFRNSYVPNAPFTGNYLCNLIKHLIEKEKPDVIFLPHPDDSHSDHWSTYCFVNYALNEIQLSGNSIHSIKLLTYLVHRGDFPMPAGMRPDLPLQPPATLLKNSSTRWHIYKNSKKMIEEKTKAILTYKTQLSMLKGYMLKFIRKNELFGVIPGAKIQRCTDGTIDLDGKTQDWKDVKPVVTDPSRDTFLRAIEGNADLRSIWITRDSENLYMRLDSRGPSSRFFTYRLDLSCFPSSNLASTSLRFIVTVRPPLMSYVTWIRGKSSSFRLHVASGRVIEIKMPLSGLNYPSHMMVGAQSSGPLQPSIDRTGFRTVFMH